MKPVLAALSLAVLTSCATPPPPAPPPPPPRPIAYNPPPIYAPPPINRDQCGAEPLQSLVGQPRTEIPVPVNPATRRVACTTCPVTQDYNPRRLNIFFDEDTGLVREVRCG
jgi:hypothetical protein